MLEPVKVSATEDGIRLQRWFGRHFQGLSSSEFHRLCRTGQIRINAGRCRGNEILHSGDMIRVPPNARRAKPVQKTNNGDRFSLSDLEKLRKRIIHDDEDIVVFDKPADLAVQGGTGIKMSLDKMAAAMYPHDTVLLVHRLDKETSGLIILAKNQNAAKKLADAFQSKTISKEYLALLSGNVSPKSGLLDTFMVKGQVLTDDEAGAYEKTTGAKPRRAITKYKVLGELPGFLTWIQFMPQTGRTHQLRLHAAKALGAPIVGDWVYGLPIRKESPALQAMLASNNLFLLAHRLSFRHPRTGKIMTVHAQIPDFMKPVLKFLEFDKNV